MNQQMTITTKNKIQLTVKEKIHHLHELLEGEEVLHRRQRRSPRSPRTPDNRSLTFQEFRNRIIDNIEALVNDEDDEVTLYLGSEDEGFKAVNQTVHQEMKVRNIQTKKKLVRS